VGFWDAPEAQDWGLDWHRNEGIEITFVSSGRTPFAVEDLAFPLDADRLVITRPWQRHRVGDPNIQAGRLHWLILDVGVRRPNQSWRWPSWLVLAEPDRERLTQLLRQNEQPVWTATPDIRRCFEQLSKAVERPEEASCRSRLLVHTNDLFFSILELLTNNDISLNPELSSSRRAVELFLDDLSGNRGQLALPWTVSALAEQCGLGVTAFTKYCYQLVNLTPMQYINRCRVQSAAQLLVEEPDLSITDVAAACGFSTSQYFATTFRKHQGSSPKAYRVDHS
jgi:AraC family L-rhamnose operon regulatory protein RhaS